MARTARQASGESVTRAVELSCTLEAAILSGDLKPGDRLDEVRLAERYKVSRTPIREALKHLAASGLVDLRPRQGALVARPTVTGLIDMFETMAVLEGACVGLAARRHTSADRMAILAAHEACLAAKEAEDPDHFYRCNNDFHDALWRGAHNEFLSDQALALRKQLEPYRRQITFHPGRMSLSNDEHARIMEAVFRMDADGAERLMRTHLDTLRDDVTTLVSTVYRSATAAA
jgi:DNA-binding GntR family transcriptional regulator